MTKTVTWILLADGAQARVLEYAGPGKGLKQVEDLNFSQENLQGKDILSDRAGRSASSSGTRAAIEPKTDPVEYRETEFVKSVAEVLNRSLEQGKFDRLVIAAAPIALGDLRKAISPAVKKAVIAELSKDLTNVPGADLAKHLDDVLAI